MGVRPILACVAAAAVAATFQPREIAAQQIPSPYRFVDESQAVGLFAGYFAADEGELELGPRSAPLLGGRYTIRLTGPISVEGEMGVLPTQRTVWDVDTDALQRIPVGEADLTLLLLSGAMRFNLTGPRTYHGVMPFVLAGGGAAIQTASDDALNAELSPRARYRFGTTFAGHVGGGVEWFGLGRLTLRGDARVVFWEVEAPEAFLDLDPITSSKEWVQNYVLALSLSYRF